MAKLTIRVDLAPRGAVGPGKIRLLELIGETGSISAAGRAMNMSYRRAWLLIDELNRLFRHPLVATRLGGSAGGGAMLTRSGKSIVRHYRDMEIDAQAAAAAHLRAFQMSLAAGRPRRSSRKTSAERNGA